MPRRGFKLYSICAQLCMQGPSKQPEERSEGGGSSGSGTDSKASSSASGGSIRAAEEEDEPTRTDKISMTGVQGGKAGFLRSLVTCYWGPDMSEDESHHPGGGEGGSPNGSAHGGGAPGSSRAGSSAAAALLCSDRTVVRTLGDTVRGRRKRLIWPFRRGPRFPAAALPTPGGVEAAAHSTYHYISPYISVYSVLCVSSARQFRRLLAGESARCACQAQVYCPV